MGVASAVAGAGTFAYLSDTESSTGNEITAGVLNLDSVATGQISVTNVAPGDSIPGSGSNIIQATYDADSTIDAEVDLDVTLSEPSEPAEPPDSSDETVASFAGQLNLDTANVTHNGSQVIDLTTSPQSLSTVADLAGTVIDAAVPTVAPGDTVGLELAITFDSGAGNAYQADGVLIDAGFVAQQPSED